MVPRNERLLGLYVLVVEDHCDTLEVFDAFIRLYGAEVISVASAHDALSSLAIARPSVMVVDYGMPGLNGCEFLERVKTLRDYGQRPVPAILCSAETRLGEAAKAAGFSSYLTKPVDLEALIEEIARVAERGLPGRPAQLRGYL
jgi:two-component system OmpR family response regulator